MRPVLLSVFCVGGAVLALHAKVGAGLANGISFDIETHVQPPIAANLDDLISEGGVIVKKAAQRYIIDRGRGMYFGYDLDAERLPDGSFRVYIKPLTATPDQVSPRGLKLAMIASYPEPQIVRDGEVILLPLMEGPRGYRIVDRIQVSTRTPAGSAFPPEKEPRDFTMLDVSLQLHEPMLSRNGKPLEPNGRLNLNGIGGPIVWLYVPDRGRFLLSILPHQGYAFERSGTIQGNRLTFSAAGDSYVCQTKFPILSNTGTWNLYVRHEPGYRPERNEGSGYRLGSAERIEYLTRRP